MVLPNFIQRVYAQYYKVGIPFEVTKKNGFYCIWSYDISGGVYK